MDVEWPDDMWTRQRLTPGWYMCLYDVQLAFCNGYEFPISGDRRPRRGRKG